MQLLQMMISTGQLAEFIDGFQEATDEETMWEFYLHKVEENISFDTFKSRFVQPVESSECNLETTIKENYEMMENFHPE